MVGIFGSRGMHHCQRTHLSKGRCRGPLLSLGLFAAAAIATCVDSKAFWARLPRAGSLVHRPSAPLSAQARPQQARLRRAAGEDGQAPSGLTPLGDNVILEPKEAESVTKGGLLLPTSGKEKPNEGAVLAVGPGKIDDESGELEPLQIQVGEKVLYQKYGAEKVTFDGTEYVLISDRDVLLSYTGDEVQLDNLKLPRGKVLIELLEEEKESGGIMLAKGAARRDTTLGKVVAVSDGYKGRDGKVLPLEVAVGETVRFRYGDEVKLEVRGSEYRVVDAEDCLVKWSS